MTVVVCSCDAYSDLWRPFFTLFFRHWSDCPWNIVLMSNESRFTHPLVETMCVGHLDSWSSELRAVLRKITSSHVLLLLDDFFLRMPVNQEQIELCFQKLITHNGNMLRLLPRPGPDILLPNEDLIGLLATGAPYRISMQSSIWRKSVLDSLLIDGESIWEFETLGSRRSDALDGLYAVRKAVMPYWHHVVERGKWFRWEAKRFSRMDIGCDFSRRAIMTRPQQFSWYVRKGIGLAYNAIPWKWRRHFRWLRIFQKNSILPDSSGQFSNHT